MGLLELPERLVDKEERDLQDRADHQAMADTQVIPDLMDRWACLELLVRWVLLVKTALLDLVDNLVRKARTVQWVQQELLEDLGLTVVLDNPALWAKVEP